MCLCLFVCVCIYVAFSTCVRGCVRGSAELTCLAALLLSAIILCLRGLQQKTIENV